MKMKIQILFLLALIYFQPCVAQQTKTALPKVENHLPGELDYTYEALELVQSHINGQEIVLGKINKDGTVQFNLPEFDVKSHFESVPAQNYKFPSLFLMQGCKDRDAFAETPFDVVYAKNYDPIFIKKYVIEECEIMIEGLKSIMTKSEFNFINEENVNDDEDENDDDVDDEDNMECENEEEKEERNVDFFKNCFIFFFKNK
jgi:hypothetical protein